MRYFFSLLVLVCVMLTAEEQTTPLQLNVMSKIAPSNKMRAATLSKILVTPANFPKSISPTKYDRIKLIALHLSPREKQRLETLLTKKYLFHPLIQSTIEEMRRDIISFYQSVYRPFILVRVPSQDFSKGSLHLEIIESKIGSLSVTGEKYFPRRRYTAPINLKEGQRIETNTLNKDLAWINRNPFQSAEIYFTPGSSFGTTDIEIKVNEKTPMKVFVGGENTGFPETQQARWTAGILLGNLFNLAQILSYQYTASYNFKDYMSHVIHYTMPFPWRHLFKFTAGLSEAKVPEHNHADYDSKGKSYQLSGRYIIPLAPAELTVLDIILGIDFKRTNSNVFYSGEEATADDANIFQFMIGYHGSYKRPSHVGDFFIEVFVSPGALLPDMTGAYYNSLRPKARSNYVYVRGGIDMLFPLTNGMSLATSYKGQLAPKRLLPSEQFGLGGHYSVRGYLERVVNADNAFLMNLEGRLPEFSIFRRNSKKNKDLWQLHFFSDFGLGGSQLKSFDQTSVSFLWGIGPGVFMHVGDNIQLKVDWGCQLVKSPHDNNRMRVTYTASLSF